MGQALSLTKGVTFGPSKCGCPLVHVKHSWSASSGTDDKKGGRPRVPGQLLLRSHCKGTLYLSQDCTFTSCPVESSCGCTPCTPGFHKPRPHGADVPTGTAKPWKGLLVGPNQLLLLSRTGVCQWRRNALIFSKEETELQQGHPA